MYLMFKKISILLVCSSFLYGVRIQRITTSSEWTWGTQNPTASDSFITFSTIGSGSFSPPSYADAQTGSSNDQDSNDQDSDIDHSDSDFDSDDDTASNDNDSSDSNGTTETDSPPGQGTYDSDDDVPTLLSIRSKIHTLQQELQSQMETTRGTTQVYNPETNTTESKEVALSDLYNSMQSDQEQARIAEDAKQSEIDSEKANLEDSIEIFEEDLTEVMDEITIATIASPSPSTLDTKFEMDIGSYNFYLDPMKDLYSGGIDIGYDWEDFASWISVVIGAIAVIVYFTKVRALISKVLETLAIAPMSSPVTSLTFFGTSIGTLGLILIKLGSFVILIGGTLLSSLLVLLESKFKVGENTLAISEVITDFTSILSGGGFMANATALLFDLIPIVSIGSMVMLYSTQAFLVWLFISMTISTSKAVT